MELKEGQEPGEEVSTVKVPIIKIVEPHTKVSKEVKSHDLPDIFELFKPCQDLMKNLVKIGAFSEIYALAHCQITKNNPLRFFVFNENSERVKQLVEDSNVGGYLIINPEIIRHTNTPVIKKEGCLTFLGMGNVDVERYQKIVVKYQTLADNKTELEDKELACSGTLAQVFCHEIDHFNAIYIHKLPKQNLYAKLRNKLRK
jgi:peptide deformylase